MDGRLDILNFRRSLYVIETRKRGFHANPTNLTSTVRSRTSRRMIHKKPFYSANLKIFVVRNDNVQQCTRNNRPVRGTRHENNSLSLFRVRLRDNYVFLSFSTNIIMSKYCRIAFVGGVGRCFVAQLIQSFPFTFDKKPISSE